MSRSKLLTTQMDSEKLEIFRKVIDKIPDICYAGNPVLRRVASSVSLEDGLKVAQKLKKVLLKYRELTGWGRGIAAPQIGENRAVFITYIDDKFETFVNPKIIEKSDKKNFYRELCMSAGNLAADVDRPEWIVMEWTDETGARHHEKFDGFKARLYQHEEAHLRGHLNLDDAVPGGIQFLDFDPLKEQLRGTR